MFEQGLLSLSGWETLAYTLLLTHISIVGVTLYLHRSMAHRAMDMHPILSHFFRFWLWLTTATVTREWVSVHRKHHAKCETEDDPHSPVVKGLKKVLLTGAELYRTEANNDETLNRYGKGCPNDWLENNVYTKRKYWGIVFMFILNAVLLGPIGITVWAIQMLWMPFHAAGVINGLGHALGYRNFECADAATNITPWAFWIGGEELHNNHHTYPNSAKLSVRKWEFDIGWMYVRLFSALGLIKNIRRGPVAHVDAAKLTLDKDSALAAANNRFQIMARYRKQVIAPLVKREKAKAGKESLPLFKRAKRLMAREDSLLSERHRKQLSKLMENNETMETLYRLRRDLQDVWKKRSASREELLSELQAWCKQAEESGIRALQEFSMTLKQYTTRAA